MYLQLYVAHLVVKVPARQADKGRAHCIHLLANDAILPAKNGNAHISQCVNPNEQGRQTRASEKVTIKQSLRGIWGVHQQHEQRPGILRQCVLPAYSSTG